MKAYDWLSEVNDETNSSKTESGSAQLVKKEKESHFDQTWSAVITRPSGSTTNLNGSYRAVEDSESISYENTKFLRFGNCLHQKHSFRVRGGGNSDVLVGDGKSNPSLAVRHEANSPIGWLAASDGNKLQPWKSYPNVATHLSVSLDPPDIDSLLASAIEEMKPEIKSELSLLVSLAELGDVRSVVKAPLAIARRLNKALLKGSFLDIVKATAKGASDTYLTHVFGTRQISNDLSGIVNAVMTVDEQLNDLVKKVGTVQKRHWSAPLVTSEAKDSQYFHFDKNWAAQRDWSTGVSRKFVVTMKYTYELVDALGNPLNPRDIELLTFGAYLDKFGLKLDPQIIWDLIPFSFIVDWFIGIGDWLGSFKRNNLNSIITILDLCYSIKTETTSNFSTVRICSRPGQVDVSSNGPLCGICRATLTDKEYLRQRVFPKASWIFGTDSPSLEQIRNNQLITGLSLITSNLLR